LSKPLSSEGRATPLGRWLKVLKFLEIFKSAIVVLIFVLLKKVLLKVESVLGIRGNERLTDYNLRQKEVSGFVCFNFSSSDNTTKYQ
jgi:hypothetical protein